MRILLIGSVVVFAGACAGGQEPYPAGGPPPEVVQAMQAPETPYNVIYHPPVWLGKEGTQPGSQQRR